MLSFKILYNELLSVILALCFLFESTASAEEYTQVGLAEHNRYRALHRNTEPMESDPDLNAKAATCAQYYADKGTIDHSCPHKGSAGENLYLMGSAQDSINAAKSAVQMWYEEIKDYDYAKPGFTMGTGHFTQVVWKDSRKLGIGHAINKGQSLAIVVGLYSPPGNFGNSYEENVHPLVSGTADILRPGKSQKEQLLFYFLVVSVGLLTRKNLLSLY